MTAALWVTWCRGRGEAVGLPPALAHTGQDPLNQRLKLELSLGKLWLQASKFLPTNPFFLCGQLQWPAGGLELDLLPAFLNSLGCTAGCSPEALKGQRAAWAAP